MPRKNDAWPPFVSRAEPAAKNAASTCVNPAWPSAHHLSAVTNGPLTRVLFQGNGESALVSITWLPENTEAF